MTDDTDDLDDIDDLGETTERIETIIDQLEEGEVSLERARTLYDEGQELLAELEAQLDIGEGTVEERSE